MNFCRLRSGFFLLLATLLAPAGFAASTPARATPTRPADASSGGAGYKGAIIVDAATGNVLFEDKADLVNPPASMTKLMTFAVLHDKLERGEITLQTKVTVTAPDTHIGGTRVWLKEKEVFSVEELIYAMMVQSANDCAYLLAHATAGSVPAFVDLMNAKARELEMLHTTFRTPHGLPPADRKIADSDVSTPRDFSLLSRYLLLKTDVLKYTSVRSRPFGSSQRLQAVDMENHDKLLGTVGGVDGLKTGYTGGAGYCISATALRNNHRVIVVTMGGADSKSRDLKVAELLARGFSALPVGGPAFVGPTEVKSPISAVPDSPITLAPNQPGASKAPTPTPDDSPVIKISVPPPKKK